MILLRSSSIVIAILFIAEILCRNLITSPIHFIDSSNLGIMPAPNQTILHTKEGFAKNTLNNFGLNSENIIANPQNHKPRVLMLGDSYLASMQVARENNFVSILQKSNPQIEILNAGVDGANPIFEYFLYQKLKKIYPPTTTIMFVNKQDIAEILEEQMAVNTNNENKITSVKYSPEVGGEFFAKLIFYALKKSALATYLIAKFLPKEPAKIPPEIQSKILAGSYLIKQKTTLTNLLKFIFKNMNKLKIFYIPQVTYHANGFASIEKNDVLYAKFFQQIATESSVKFYNLSHIFLEDYKKNNHPAFGFNNSNITKGHLNLYGHKLIAKVLQNDI